MVKRMASGLPPDPWFDSFDAAKNFYYRYIELFESMIGNKEWGSRIEIGAGSGMGSAILSNFPNVNQIAISDNSELLVEKVIPRCAELFGDITKIVPLQVDYLKMSEKIHEMDFVLAFATLHHSPELRQTISEIYKSLKKGGYLLAVERAHPDTMSDRKMKEQLYSLIGNETKKLYGFSEKTKITRMDLGEHELRMCEWKKVFTDNGFELLAIWGEHSKMYNPWFNVAFWAFGPLLAVKKMYRFFIGSDNLFLSNLKIKLQQIYSNPRLNIFYYLFIPRYVKSILFKANNLKLDKKGNIYIRDHRWIFRSEKPHAVNALFVCRKV